MGFVKYLCLGLLLFYSSYVLANSEKCSREDINVLFPKITASNDYLKYSPLSNNPVSPKNISIQQQIFKSNKSGERINLPHEINSIYICEKNTTYYAQYDVSINGGALICEPNSVIYWEQNTGLYVENGFLSIRGTCENRVKFLPEMPYMGYWKGIYLYGNNEFSCPSEILYAHIQGALVGIYLENISLSKSIQHNIIEYCYWGIFSFGTKQTKISNNAFYFCGDYIKTEYGYEPLGAGIEAYHSSVLNQEDPNSVIEIEFNTFLDNLIGVWIHGSSKESLAGITVLNHNVYCSSLLYNVALTDGYMHILSDYNGYYNKDNSKNKNWDFPETNDVVENRQPLENQGGLEKFCLRENSSFVGKGKMPIYETEYVGSSCTMNQQWDIGKIDLGFHQYHWNIENYESNVDSNSLWADFNNSGIVDFNDLALFTENWLKNEPNENISLYSDPNKTPDYNRDGTVDCYDFSEFSKSWMKTENTTSSITFLENLAYDGSLEIKITSKLNAYQYFLLIDGIFIKQFSAFDLKTIHSFYIPWITTGYHKIQIIGLSEKGLIRSKITPVFFKKTIGACFITPETKDNSSLSFFVANKKNTLLIKVNDYEKTVWQKECSPGTASGCVPKDILQNHDVDYVSVEMINENETSEECVIAPCSVFRTNKNDIRALIVLPNFKLNRVNSGLITLYKKMFKQRNVPFQVLGSSSSSIKNLKKYAQNYHIQYLIINTHGNYVFPGTQIKRTVLELDDGIVVSDKISRNPSASYLVSLPYAIENTVLTIAEVGFYDLCYVHYDSCYSGKLYIDSRNQLVEGKQGQTGLFSGPHNDMTMALNLSSNRSKFYFGWFSNFIAGYTSDHYQFSCDIICTLTEGKKLDEALLHAINDCRASSPPDPRNEYRIKGQGNLSDIKVR
jgi:hypothetical protein